MGGSKNYLFYGNPPLCGKFNTERWRSHPFGKRTAEFAENFEVFMASPSLCENHPYVTILIFSKPPCVSI